MVCFAVAETLHQPVHEVESWPLAEIRDWVAYFEIKERRRRDDTGR